MRMVLLENVERLRLLLPYILLSKTNTYGPDRIFWYYPRARSRNTKVGI